MAKHFLAVETQVEDIGIKLMLQNLYNEEFNEVQPERKNGVFGELENLSAEDKQFMKMMENGAEFVNGHYQLPLPLRNPALIMLNNRTMVEKRANYLKGNQIMTFVKLMDLFFETCLVLKNKSINFIGNLTHLLDFVD